MHQDDVDHMSRLVVRYPKVTPADLAQWPDKPLFEALKAYSAQRFWAHCDAAAKRVESWPDWMKGSPEKKRQEKYGEKEN